MLPCGGGPRSNPVAQRRTAGHVADQADRRIGPGQRQEHVERETMARALAMVIEAQSSLPMARFWGAGLTASSDGQFFRKREFPCTFGVV